MKYHGKLYGKLWDKYFDTDLTTEEWDAMEKRIEELEAENLALKQVNGIETSHETALHKHFVSGSLHSDEVIDNTFPITDEMPAQGRTYNAGKRLGAKWMLKKLPNLINMGALANLLKYSNKYEITIQFWPDIIAVYIRKDGVLLKDFGGDFEFAVSNSIAYLDRITGNDR